MAILSALFGHFTGQFQGLISSSVLVAVQEVFIRGRQALRMVMTSFVCSILVAAGILISLLEISAQYDSHGAIVPSAMLISGFGLTIISLLVLVALFWTPNKGDTVTATQNTTAHEVHQSPLEQALATLILEGVTYLREKRDGSHQTDLHSRSNLDSLHTH